MIFDQRQCVLGGKMLLNFGVSAFIKAIPTAFCLLQTLSNAFYCY
jgi:hypothetical protein